MTFLILFTQSVLPIFLILAAANIYYRVFKPDIRQLVNISLYIFAPAVVFHELVKNGIGASELGRSFVLMLVVTFALMVLGYLCAKAIRLSESDAILFMLSVSMINIGNFGVPLIYFAYGQSASYHSILTFIAFNIPLVTIAIFFTSESGSIRGSLKDMARIPIFHSTVLALLLNSFSIPVPDMIFKLSGFLGNAAFPFLIFILGLQLATIKMNRKLAGTALFSVFLKLGAAPFVAMGGLSLLSFEGLAYSVPLVQISGPSALLPLMYAIKFGKKSDLLAAAILLSTALSAITLPVIIYLLG